MKSNDHLKDFKEKKAGKEKIRKSESRKYNQINEHRKDTKEEKK